MIRAMVSLQRHYHDRLLGGVCGGLAAHFFRPGAAGARFYGSAAFWRALFMVLIPVTLGGVVWLYLAFWYGLPGEAPVPTLPKPARQVGSARFCYCSRCSCCWVAYICGVRTA